MYTGERKGRQGMGVSAVVIQEFLRGMDYPSQRDDILDRARRNNAPDDVMDILNQIPDKEYNSAGDVSKAVSDIK
jgi:hypothetical protein